MSIVDTILEKLRPGAKYETLNYLERDMVMGLAAKAYGKSLTIDDIKKHIGQMKVSVERELSDPNLDKNKDLFLKARLKNYLLLEALFAQTEKARAELDNYLKNIERSQRLR